MNNDRITQFFVFVFVFVFVFILFIAFYQVMNESKLNIDIHIGKILNHMIKWLEVLVVITCRAF